MMNRASDRAKMTGLLVGSVLVLAGVGLKFALPHSADWLIIALVIVGAGLISPSFVLDLVKAWRAKA